MKWKVAGVNFDHFHMGDLLRMVHDHPAAEIVAVCDERPERMAEAIRELSIPPDRVWSETEPCLAESRPDFVILCPAAARHAEWVERVAPFGSAVLVEKPFAASLAEADRMVAAMAKAGRPLAINWPLAWFPSHLACHELIRGGTVGEVLEVRYHDGNRGPLWHGAGKVEREPDSSEKASSWFYREAEGGGSLRDYLGYGTTLASWFNGGRRPLEVMAMWDHRPGGALEVDEHSVTVVRYETGLSTFETRWGMLSDPWTVQPEPRCGFVVRGSDGDLSSWDYDDHVTLRTRARPEGERIPAPPPAFPRDNPVAYVLDCLGRGAEIEGPLSVAVSRLGQEIVDAAIESARSGRAVAL
jgi:predicted dehydrogenase